VDSLGAAVSTRAAAHRWVCRASPLDKKELESLGHCPKEGYFCNSSLQPVIMMRQAGTEIAVLAIDLGMF
jgi:hypothetical protein